MCETCLEDCMLRMSWAIAMHSMVWLVSSGLGLKSQQLMRPPDLHVLQTSTALGSVERSHGDIAPPTARTVMQHESGSFGASVCSSLLSAMQVLDKGTGLLLPVYTSWSAV
jgi:uncharacterized protein YfaT (DUF1175 family)